MVKLYEGGIQMVLKKGYLHHGWFIFLLVVLISNFSLYNTAIGNNALPGKPNAVVLGSIFDLAFLSPILYMTWKRKWTWKRAIVLIASGLILVRFFIPMEYLAPFKAVTWVGFAVEGGIVLLEILVLVTLFKHLPNIIRTVKRSSLPVVFSFSNAADSTTKNIPIIRVICSEMLMFYYAFASWKKQPKLNHHTFTLHRNSNLITFQVMLVHAIVLESIGLHWWLHNQSVVLSIVLLVINVYSVIFILGDIQAVRLNPLQMSEDRMYISLGLMKRMEIKYEDIEEIVEDSTVLEKKLSENTIDFVARDFEPVSPHVILKLKHPVKATLIMGMKKQYNQVAIRVDESDRFMRVLKEKRSKALDIRNESYLRSKKY